MEFYSLLLLHLANHLMGTLDPKTLTLTELQCLTDLKELLYGDDEARDLVTVTLNRWNSDFPKGMHPLSWEGKHYLREYNAAQDALIGTPLEQYVRAYMR